uniref:Exonuclease domain-containing protein n=1 Tax=Palpitomonas bilix TaxID=652834 RepID=A0A7S3D2N4_9EUKA|mmetsp:Transcript_19132/g.48980  ORF Transcript_19132/g.48980 Transcript_19132/m.48980 type:complete len:240 (+) Transcript_19132:607-1326(+)
MAAHGCLWWQVVDFEAQCNDGQRIQPQEIIEFPLLALNTRTLEVDFEFHHYVRPVAHPVLTQFCTELTGIEQHTVEGADTFPVVLEKCTQLLIEKGLLEVADHDDPGEIVVDKKGSKHFITTQTRFVRPCIFLSCGDWDFKTCLPGQCHAIGMSRYPKHFFEWINVKKVFSEVKGYRCPGMARMLEELNIELKGRHHSGIDDSRNIADMVRYLIRKGGSFTTISKLEGYPPRIGRRKKP